MRFVSRFAVCASVAFPALGCGPAPEPVPPPAVTAAPSVAPSVAPSAAASVASTATAVAAVPAPPPPAGSTRLALVLRGHWSDKPKGTLPASIDVPAEWAVRKISDSITSLEPCAQHGIIGGLRLFVKQCSGKGEAACLEANTLPPEPARARLGELEDLGPSRRFALARSTKGSGLVVVEGSAAVYDAETDQAAVCAFETLDYDKAAQAAYSAACRTLLVRPAGVTATDPVEKPATPGGFPATNADSFADGPALVAAARAFVAAAGRNDMAEAKKLMLTDAVCKTNPTFAGKPFTGADCRKESKDANELLQLWMKKLPAGFEPGAVANIVQSRPDQYTVAVYGTKTPCEKPQQVILIKLSSGLRAIPLPSPG